MDLPAPWEAILTAKEALKQDIVGRICCFSPCFEQVAKTCQALKEHGFQGKFIIKGVIYNFNSLIIILDIRMVETLQKPYEVDHYTKSLPLPLLTIEENKAESALNQEASQPINETQKEHENAPVKKRKINQFESISAASPFLTSKPCAEVRGHTSYLTFATLFPKIN